MGKCHQSGYQGGVEAMEGKLNGNHLRLIPGLCLEDKINYIKYRTRDFYNNSRETSKKTRTHKKQTKQNFESFAALVNS